MRPTFLPRLVNGPLFDPVLFVRLLNQRGAVMFDCGRIEGLANREILSLEAVFLTHTHMDHFMGFDHVLRTILHREEPLHVYGPAGVIDKVAARLGSYTWNLTGGYPLEIVIHEVGQHETAVSSASAREGFRASEPVSIPREGDTIASRTRYCVDAVVLDHGVPCLGFLLREPLHIHVKSSALSQRGYRSGPWIGELKDRILAGDLDERIPVSTASGTDTLSVADLMHELVVTSDGHKIAFITDIRASQANIEGVERLARGTDALYIESYYLSDREREACDKAHLTARQAGLIARRLGAKRVFPMHVSPRYHDRIDDVMKELEGAKNGA